MPTPEQLRAAIFGGQEVLRGASVWGALIGTANLWLRGYRVDPPDVDFIVANAVILDPLRPDVILKRSGNAFGLFVGGVGVDFVLVDDRTLGCLPNWDPCEFVGTTPLASVEQVLEFKRLAGREKDRVFLDRWARGEFARPTAWRDLHDDEFFARLRSAP